MHKKYRVAAEKTAQRENRYIYNGDRQRTVAGYTVRQNPGVRPAERYSTFNIIIGLFAIGILVVLYINNTIAVNELLGDINTLQGKFSGSST